MWYDYRFRAYPHRTAVTAEAQRHIDIHRQAYNHTRHEYQSLDTDEDNIGSACQHRKRLTEWKHDWLVFSEVHSKTLHKTVERFYGNLSNLSEKKPNGHKIGWLERKAPREHQSMIYSQSGLELKTTSGRSATLWFSKIGDIPIRYHREVPDNAVIKEVTLKKERTGEWYVTCGLEVEDTALPERPDVDELSVKNCVGIDLGIQNYIYTSNGDSVDWLGLADDDRLRREQHSLSRKQHDSNNWKNQRQQVAKVKRRIKRTVEDSQHKPTTWLVTVYDAVFVEDLNISGMLQSEGSAQNKQAAAVHQDAGVQRRPMRYARRPTDPYQDDQGVRRVWRGDGHAGMGARTQLPELWVQRGQGRGCVVERSCSRCSGVRSGTGRRHACGDCDRCGN